MQDKYFAIIMLVERLQRLFLDVIKAELDRLKIVDINNVQCLILYNIGENKLSVGEVTNRGYYLGSNVTYNLKKMVETGYVVQEQSPHDKRSSHVHLSKKGLELFKNLEAMINRHIANLPRNNMDEKEVKSLLSLMERLESFWSFMVSRELRF